MKKVLLIIALTVPVLTVLSQTPFYSFVHIGREWGLASNDVYDICQDHRGFYWICTDNGLQRYDGKRWVSAGNSGQPFLPDEPVKQVVVLDNNELLLRFDHKFGLYNTASFTLRNISLNDSCSSGHHRILWKDLRGRVYLVCEKDGLAKYDTLACKFKQPENFKITDGFEPTNIFQDSHTGLFWIGGNKGLMVYDEKEDAFYTRTNNPKKLPLLGQYGSKSVQALFIDGDRNYWLILNEAAQQYVCYNEQEAKYLSVDDRLKASYKGHFSIDNLFYSQDAGLWLYGRNALINYMPDKNIFQNNKSDIINQMGVRFKNVRRIFQDAEKGVWVATDQGLYEFYVSAPPVENVILRTENDDNNITDVEEVMPGHLWIARRGKGIRVIDSTEKSIDISALTHAMSLKQRNALNFPTAIHFSKRSHRIWILTEPGYIIVTDPLLREKTTLVPGQFKNDMAISITEDPSGNIWIGTDKGQLIRYDQLEPLQELSFDVIADLKTPLNKIVSDQYGTVWACTRENGLFEINSKTKRIQRHFSRLTSGASSFSSDNIRSVVRINDSTCVVAADLLNVLNIKTGHVEFITVKDGLAGNTITGFEADHQNNLWIATSNGVCRYNLQRKKITTYGKKDGFIDFENIGSSSLRLSNDNILFAGSNLLVQFSPKIFNLAAPPPDVTITDIRVLDSFIPVMAGASSRLRLSPGDNSLVFYFSAMSYLQKDKLSYYYRLVGLDNDWKHAGQQLEVAYTQLPSGKYAFEVRCENEEGISSPVTGYSFVIDPPFWKTWWFSALIVILALGLLYLFYRLKVKRIIALADLREKVARDLHDDVGSTLSTISILSQIAKVKLAHEPVQAEHYISRISDNSQQMMEAMDDIVWSIKPMNDSMQKIIARMREVASWVLEPKNIDIHFYVGERVQELKLNMESRRDLFLVFKEAINNIAKYSESSHVSIHLDYNDRMLELKIKDNGIGFDVDNADTGNGISNMKKRAATLGGTIRWQSQSGQGTQVQLIVPVKHTI